LKPLILYHAGCWDGFCAAWVARMAFGEIEAIPVQYGTEPPNVNDREVYVLDFSWSRDRLLNLKHDAKTIIVLDHHATAAEDLAGLDWCRFDLTKSGGRLAWEYFDFIGGWQGQVSPWLVDYTEDRDLWRHALPDSQAVNAALRSYPLDFALWDDFNGRHPSEFVVEGKAIRRREHQIIMDHVHNARERVMDGLEVLVVNATVLFSEIAGKLADGRPFGACYFDRGDGVRVWSLRSDPEGVNVSLIAKAHSGGGHPHAAGYQEVIGG